MDTEKTLNTAESLLTPLATGSERPQPHWLELILPPDNLLGAVQALHDAQWGYLAAITGIDLGTEEGNIEVMYHFCEGAAIVGLRVYTPRDAAVVPSVCGIIPSASFYERELSEMLGVTVEGTPNTDRLFLPDDWPDGVYPLRKDFEMLPVNGNGTSENGREE